MNVFFFVFFFLGGGGCCCCECHTIVRSSKIHFCKEIKSLVFDSPHVGTHSSEICRLAIWGETTSAYWEKRPMSLCIQ